MAKASPPSGMAIAQALLEQILAHALQDAPDECCGVVGVSPGAPRRAVSVHRAANAAAANLRPLRFEIDGLEVLRLIEQIESEGLELGAIYHSHTRTEPRPSQTDINFAKLWPGVLWIIVGLANGEVDVRTWRIDDGKVSDAELVVE
jgi:[CysO sulfur-carrier protein]-S-L-cysteine hydrolase